MIGLMRLSEALTTNLCYPPPEDKSPGALIHAWGIEMCRVGFELALSLFEGDSENEDKTD